MSKWKIERTATLHGQVWLRLDQALRSGERLCRQSYLNMLLSTWNDMIVHSMCGFLYSCLAIKHKVNSIQGFLNGLETRYIETGIQIGSTVYRYRVELAKTVIWTTYELNQFRACIFWINSASANYWSLMPNLKRLHVLLYKIQKGMLTSSWCS